MAVFLTAGIQANSTSPAENKHYSYAVWEADLENMREAIANEIPVLIPIRDLGAQEVILTEFNTFEGGQKLRPVLDTEGQFVEYEPFPYWSYEGFVIGALDSEVLITMDDRGLYGHIKALGTITWFNPLNDELILSPGEAAQVRVKWVADEDPPSLLRDAFAENQTLTAQTGAGGSGGNSGGSNCAYKGVIAPYADNRFTSKHSNFATRIQNAMAAQKSMWSKACITFTNLPVTVEGKNYSNSSNCETHLDAFFWGRGPSGADANQLFSGIKIDNANGCGLSHTTPGKKALRSESMLEAVDFWWDSYDPDETTTDLGLVSGHETTHNWGEPDHWYDGDPKCLNIMASGTDVDDRCFWHNAYTKPRVKSAAKEL